MYLYSVYMHLCTCTHMHICVQACMCMYLYAHLGRCLCASERSHLHPGFIHRTIMIQDFITIEWLSTSSCCPLLSWCGTGFYRLFTLKHRWHFIRPPNCPLCFCGAWSSIVNFFVGFHPGSSVLVAWTGYVPVAFRSSVTTCITERVGERKAQSSAV